MSVTKEAQKYATKDATAFHFGCVHTQQRGMKYNAVATMVVQSNALKIGQRAPGFELGAANRKGRISLELLLAEGNVIIEFVRGTW